MGPLEKGDEDRPPRHEHHLPARTSRSSRRSTTTARTLEQRFREMAFLTKGLKIGFKDERGAERFETNFQYDGGIIDFVKYLHSQGTREPLHPKVIYIEGSSDDRRGRGRAPVEQLLPGGAPLLRQQHQHARGRHAPVRLPLGAHRHDQPLRAAGRRAEGEGPEPPGRGRARGPHRDHLGEDRRPAVRGPDQDEARQPAGRGLRAGRGQQGPRRVPRGEPGRGAPGDPQGGRRRPRARRRPQGARPHAAQVGARELHAARQARRLLGARSRARRDLHRRGRLRRRLREAGPRPQHTGDPAAAREDHQRREEPHRQGALEQGDPGADHRDRHRDPRGVRHHERPLPQGDRDDGRRRGRRAHPHARAHLPVPRDARADRRRLRLHREAAALQDQVGQAGRLHREGVRARGGPAARQAREARGHRPRGQRVQPHARALAEVRPAAQAVRGLGRRAARRVGPRPDQLPGGVVAARRGRDRPGGGDRAAEGRRPRGRGLRDVAARGERHRGRRDGDREEDRHGQDLPAGARPVRDARVHAAS